MKKSFIYLCFLVGIVCLMEMMASCKPSLPSDVLSKGQMTDILYDYHWRCPWRIPRMVATRERV